MTECNGCGGCCDPVVLPFTQRELHGMAPTSDDAKRDRDFVLYELRQMTTREGLSRANQFGGKMPRNATFNPDDHAVRQREQMVFYECPHFDKDTRYCTNYENRPPLCRGFPLYDTKPDPAKSPALPLDCSYRIDFIEKP